MGHTFEIEENGKTRHYGVEKFLELEGGHPVVWIPEVVKCSWNGEYAGWYKTWNVEPGSYPVYMTKEVRGTGHDHWKTETVYTDDPSEAKYAYVILRGTLIGGDLQSRFGGARIGTDPIREKIGKVERIDVYVDKSRIKELLDEVKVEVE